MVLQIKLFILVGRRVRPYLDVACSLQSAQSDPCRGHQTRTLLCGRSAARGLLVLVRASASTPHYHQAKDLRGGSRRVLGVVFSISGFKCGRFSLNVLV
eukprot:405676-Amphidinium_carterae.1